MSDPGCRMAFAGSGVAANFFSSFDGWKYSETMPEIKTIDVSHIHYTSTVFPTDEDMRLWNSLSADEQRAAVRRDLDEAEASGVAESETAEEIIRLVRAETNPGR